MGRYWPIALTSTIGMVLERFIANCLPLWLEEHSALSPWQTGFRKRRSTTDQCLSWWLEEHSALSPWQTGFRKGCSTTDQCLQLSQFISDGFQSTHRRHTIATFFDNSQAYDRVWCTGILIKMSKIGAPRSITEWLSSWFINCTIKVRVNGSINSSRTFTEDLSQGSIHFTICINDLLAEIEDTFVSAYADDMLIARSTRNKNMIVVSLQPEVDKVDAWSDNARLTLNITKCKIAFISLGCGEAAWQPNITIDEKRMICNPFPA